MRKLLFTGIFLLLAGLFCACSGTGSLPETVLNPNRASTEQEDELRNLAKQYFLDIYRGLRTADYDLFIRHHLPDLQQKISEKNFPKYSEDFCRKNGELLSMRYLGCVDKYYSRIYLWAVLTKRTESEREKIWNMAEDTANIPDTESVVQLTLVKYEKEWKVQSLQIF